MKTLVILEMANNHMGSVGHAKKIIKEYNKITKPYKKYINFAIKFQYRDSKTFIHKNYRNSNDKFIKRFQSTFFSDNEWKVIVNYSKRYFKLACTPFDEPSVTKVLNQNFDYLKIASCSVTDWPLIEYISKEYKKKKRKKKVVASLGGLDENEISNVISFFNNRKIDISFLYCVAKYPSFSNEINLSYFRYLKKKYGDKIRGFSTHEDPNIKISPAIAYGAGVRLFEKHIGVETKKIKLNKYSVSPKELKLWLDNLSSAINIWGSEIGRVKNVKAEKKQLGNFKRGIFLKKHLEKNIVIKNSDVYFSFPAKKNQLTANDLKRYNKMITKKKLNQDSPLLFKDTKIIDTQSPINKIRNKVRNLLNASKVIVPKNASLEISHHYGLEKFYKYGITMINIINNAYCKKLIIVLPNQKHPKQFHKVKEESFFILYGTVTLILGGKKYFLKAGDLKTIKRNVVHEFYSKDGCVIEELSTEHIKSDSFYLDKKINKNRNRKSFIHL